MRSASVLEDLRARIAAIEGVATRHSAFAFGITAIDDHLPGGGIASGALHEVAGSRSLSDDAAATIFLAGILARTDGVVVWALRWADLFAPSLALAGLDTARVIFVEAGADSHVLTAMEEALRHAGLAAVVGEVAKLSLTASRRLQLAAEGSGVPAFIFRRAMADDADSGGSAAVTRWRVRACPSAPLGIPSLARPRWSLALERVRGGEPHHWIVEASDAQGRLALPAELVDRPLAEARRIAS